MFELVTPDAVADLIERRAHEIHTELESMVDAALVAIGIPQSTVNRRRGQLRRHRLKEEA